jgi:NADPH:quinone reductase-like Zn-dependent oxidoreductase
MRAAGVTRTGGAIGLLELPEPGELRADEVLIDVRACGVGNWDELVRTGDWDTGASPPMALGVEAAGVVAATGDGVEVAALGDAVTAHSVPVRYQGAWAEMWVAAVGHVARIPAGIAFEDAAAFPVPALTADQAVHDALRVRSGQTILVNGAGGVTGGLVVQLAAARGARVLVTASPRDARRLRALGAEGVLDYHRPGWPDRLRELTGGGAHGAVNAARSGERDAIRAIRDGGTLATITGDPPPAERGIAVLDVVVAPDGARLRRLISLLGRDALTISVAARFPLDQAAAALAAARRGSHGAATVLRPAG